MLCFSSKLWYNLIMNNAIQAIILARNPNAREIVHEYDDFYSARVGACMAYYEIRDGKIIGDVWFE